MSSFTVQIEDNPVKSIQIETSIGNNPASIEVQTFDNNIIQIESGLTFTPLEVTNLLNTRISQFLQAGSGIVLASGTDSLTIGLSNPNLQSSNILDFAQAVSGLLTITNVSAGSGISVTKSGTNYTVAVTGEFGLTPEQVDDRVSNLLLAGSNITLNYNDNANTLTISTSGLQPSGNYSIVGHSHVANDITNFESAVSGYSPIKSVAGKYGNVTLNKGDVGLSNVDNTSDLNKPISTATQSALDGKASLTHQHVVGDITNLQNILDGKQPSGNYSIVGHNHSINDVTGLQTALDNKQASGVYASGIHYHTSSDITNFDSSVSGLLPSVTGTGYINSSFNNNTYTISVSGLQPSGNYANSVHTHNYTDITDFGDGIDQEVSTLLEAGSYINLNYDNIADSLTISATGLQPSGNYSIVGHTHTASEITDFNTSVSGLLPVTNILAGSNIGVSSSGSVFTVSVTGQLGLTTEEVDDRVSQLLVAGTGVSLTYNDPSGILTIDNRHTEINILSQEPQGFVNRTDSIISFDDSSRTFTIQPAISGGSYAIYAEGVKVIKSGVETVVLGSGTALNYLHFDTTSPYTLHTKTTGFDFDTDIPIGFIHWNSDINQSTFFGEERHGIRMDSVTHKWIHNTFGMQYISGLSIGGYTLLGNGSSNSHAQIDISDGVLYQEDIIIDITDDNGTNSANEFVQPLSPIAYIPTYYHSGSTGQWVRDPATAFPVKYNGTRAQYNLLSGGTWTTPNVTNDRFFAMWIVATNDINDPILAIVGQRQDSSLNSAENNNTWSDINLTNIPTQEIRPLYRLIFRTNNSYTNTPKSSLQSILDLRVTIQSTAVGVVQNDHGSLFGLADDDHNQYVHIDNNRTISALHTFSNGLNASGLINAASGNFTSLTVNSTGVSLVGHTHTSSDITDFNTSVSGLLPVTNITGGSGIIINSTSGNFTINNSINIINSSNLYLWSSFR